MEDSGILELYFLRNEQALRETSKKYGAYCSTIAYGILQNREDTEETVNDTWLSAWNAIPPKRPGCLQGFLGRITRNASIDRWRRRTAEKRGGEMVLALEELGRVHPLWGQCGAAGGGRGVGADAGGILKTLPVERRADVPAAVLVSHAPRRRSRLGWTEGRVKTALHRVRRQLLVYLQERGMLDEA